MLKKRSRLKQQVVRRKKGKRFSSIRRMITLITSSFIKFSFLVVGLVMISLLFLGLYQYLLTSPYIKLEKVIVKGVDEKIECELLEMAQLRFDLSLLAININELKQKLEEHPWIRFVHLEKRFPHTLIIHAQMERPYAVVAMGELYYMDQYGKIFKKVEPNEDIDYPVITGVYADRNDQHGKLKLAAHVLNALKGNQGRLSRADISEIHVKEAGTVSLYFLSIPAVITVKGDELDMKIEELKRVVEHLNSTGRIHMVRGINLDYDDGAVVAFRNS